MDVSSSLELFRTSSSSRISLAAFPRAWLRTHLVESALRPLILRPCRFKYIFSWLFVSASTSFSFFQEMLDGRVFLSLALYFAFASKNSRCSTYILHAVSSTLYWEQSSCNVLPSEEDNFPSLSNFFIWTLGRSLSIPSPMDVAVVNGRCTPGESAPRAGTGERLTGTPVVQPSFLHPTQAGVQENFSYSRKYWPWRTWSSFISSEAFQIKHSHPSMFYSARKICSIWLGVWPRRTKSASLEGNW